MLQKSIRAVSALRERAQNVVIAGFVAAHMSPAFAGDVDLSNFRSSTGVGSKKFDDQANQWLGSLNTGVKIFLAIVCFAGIAIFVSAFMSLNKAKREDRDAPPAATYGMIIGAALTCVPVLIGFIGNSLAG